MSTAFALPANWTRQAPPLTPPGRRPRTVTSAPTTLATSPRTSAGSPSGWVPWFIGSKGRSPLGWLVPPSSAEPGPNLGRGRDHVHAAAPRHDHRSRRVAGCPSVQQRSTATVPRPGTFTTIRRRFCAPRPSRQRSNAAPLQAGAPPPHPRPQLRDGRGKRTEGCPCDQVRDVGAYKQAGNVEVFVDRLDKAPPDRVSTREVPRRDRTERI